MRKSLSGPVAAGILVIVVIAVLFIGYRYMAGGRSGERPAAIASDPHMSRMYPMAAGGGANASPQQK